MALVAPARKEPDFHGPEKQQLTQWLDYQRATLLMKCAGLDDAALAAAAVPPSNMTLLGILRHMTDVEHHWFDMIFAGSSEPSVYWSSESPEGDWLNLTSASVDEVARRYATACERSRQIVEASSLEDLARASHPSTSIDLRWVCLHMIEEYARHNGHADLLRECLDGATGD